MVEETESDEIRPTPEEPYVSRTRRNSMVYHTSRCVAVKKVDDADLKKRSEVVRDTSRYTECELCSGDIDRGTQRTSFAKKLRSDQFEVRQPETQSMKELDEIDIIET